MTARDRFAKRVSARLWRRRRFEGAFFQTSPIGKTKFVVLFPSTDVLPLPAWRAQRGRPARFGQFTCMRCHALRGINRLFERDAARARGARARFPQDVRRAPTACVFEARFSRIGHHVHLDELSGFRVSPVGCQFLTMNGLTPKPSAVTYLRLATGRGRRYTDTVGVGLLSP